MHFCICSQKDTLSNICSGRCSKSLFKHFRHVYDTWTFWSVQSVKKLRCLKRKTIQWYREVSLTRLTSIISMLSWRISHVWWRYRLPAGWLHAPVSSTLVEMIRVIIVPRLMLLARRNTRCLLLARQPRHRGHHFLISLFFLLSSLSLSLSKL